MVKYFFTGLVLLQTLSLAQNIVIETYGDSITAGLLSYTNITQKNELSEVSRILSDFAMFKLTKNRDFLIKHEKTEIAWPTLLANHLKTDLVDYEIRNYALSGARSDSMLEEVKKAALPKDEVIAFFFIGHNDLCHNKGSEEDLARDFSRNLKEALIEWDQKHFGARAYLISLAEIQHLYSTLSGVTWYEGSKGKYKCEDNWENLFPYCPSFFKKYKQGTLDEYIQPRLRAVNSELDKLSEEFKSSSRRNQYFRLGMAEGSTFRKEYFAIDCYHLSQEGQQFVADQIFDSLAWY